MNQTDIEIAPAYLTTKNSIDTHNIDDFNGL